MSLKKEQINEDEPLKMTKGKLSICPTPIGNLEDMTFRVLRTLKEADVIAAEDTRHTLKLLNYYQIQKKMISYHEHNTRTAGERIVGLLEKGLHVALVTDAGMPGISDPGEDVIRLCVEAGLDMEVLPGPSAFVNALVGSGLPTGQFVFEGFLKRDKKDRKIQLGKLAEEERTTILYEAPHRLAKTLKVLLAALGNRKIALCRELTKLHETYERTDLETALAFYEENPCRGEWVLVLSGKPAEPVIEVDAEDLEKQSEIEFKALAADGVRFKEAVRLVSEQLEISKNDAYALGLLYKKKHEI